jgi:hypothetical protein
VPAHEAEAFVDDVEDPARVGVAGPFRLALEDPLDEVVLALLGARLELEIAADRAQLRDAHLAEIGDVEVVPLARGLELLLLLELRDGGTLDLAASPGTAIARTLVWTELGHGLGGSLRRRGPCPGWDRAESIRCAGRSGMRGIICSTNGSVNEQWRNPDGIAQVPGGSSDLSTSGRRQSVSSAGARSRREPSNLVRR